MIQAMLASLALVFSTVIVQGAAPEAAAKAEEKTLSPEQEMKFYDQLRAEIKKSYDQLNKMVQTSRVGGNMPSKNEKKKLEEAATGLEVKVILFRNFYQTPSVQSPKVREELLKLFKKEFITSEELTDLKTLVAKERPKYI